MNVSEAIQSRRSIKQFDPKYAINDSQVRELLSAALLTPSAFNIQHWRFIQIKDSALRQQIKGCAWGQSQVTDASLLLLVCMDLNAWDKAPHRYCSDADAELQETIISNMRNYYSNNLRDQRDEAFRSASMATMTIMLKAQEMGFDSCPMALDYEKTSTLINLPDDHALCMMLAIGKRATAIKGRDKRLRLDEVFVVDKFT